MIYCFDLDGTLCSDEKGAYEKAIPFEERIEKVNSLFEEGNTIIIDSARGSETKKDWLSLTETQLKTWGVKYNSFRVGQKIHADIYVDDKAINCLNFF